MFLNCLLARNAKCMCVQDNYSIVVVFMTLKVPHNFKKEQIFHKIFTFLWLEVKAYNPSVKTFIP